MNRPSLVNIGYSSRLPYDNCAYPDKLQESTSPLQYRLDGNQMYNCNGCLSTLGPRSGFQGNGVSTAVGQPPATSQQLVDVESVLKNINVKTSKCKTGHLNDIDVTKFKLQHARICNKFLDPLASRLVYPAQTYRDMAVNRFYDLPTDPQAPIFWDFSTNTRLESKDNFDIQAPHLWPDQMGPTEIGGRVAAPKIRDGAFCPPK